MRDMESAQLRFIIFPAFPVSIMDESNAIWVNIMEMTLSQFLPALGAIVVIDLALAGANAVVILLAASNLPPHLNRRAIVWGTLIAIFVRTKLTLVSVSLLKEPYLMLAGGAVLLWAAYRLLTQPASEGPEAAPSTSFMSAMQTIIVADVVIGLDNVLAVAGAAHGNPLLVPVGLMMAIPILIWGAPPILKLLAYLPSIVYFGGAVIAWTAAKMVAGEPFVNEWLDDSEFPEWPIHAAFVLGTVSFAWLVNRRRPSTGQHP